MARLQEDWRCGKRIHKIDTRQEENQTGKQMGDRASPKKRIRVAQWNVLADGLGRDGFVATELLPIRETSMTAQILQPTPGTSGKDISGGSKRFHQTLVNIIPTNEDVLSGRGKPIANHPGNVIFRDISGMFHSAYHNGSICNKKKISQSVKHIFEFAGKASMICSKI